MASIQLKSPAGVLVGLYDAPQLGVAASSAGSSGNGELGSPGDGPLTAAVVCHPHPLQGGTMDNKVAFTLARTLRERGLHVVRFNFRGAGGSQGTHDEGRGEQEDARAALNLAVRMAEGGVLEAGDRRDSGLPPVVSSEIARPAPKGSVLLAGFSFGSYVALSAGLEDERVGALLAVAPPVNHYPYPETGDFDVPLGVVWAGADELVPAARVEAWVRDCPGADVHARCVDDATHLFHARLAPLREGVESFLDHVTGAP